ncbi:alpha/beta fold hydrolase [Ectothiorhodospiraceae bacterium 2226]|nr:alpha/beta fold hydrolase [Ectothiorhodospiraceae bacterium 2226]
MQDYKKKPSRLRRGLAGGVLALLCWSAGAAEEVSLEVQPGLTATAHYQPGEADRPAVLLLHGFLQTREFHTVARLAESLSIAGVTTLAPTLSLNVPHRRAVLSCEAVHTHTMDQALDEIGAWIDWLQGVGHKDIVLLGHSYGGVQLAAYLGTRPAGPVSRLIAVSLVDVEHGVGASVHVDLRRVRREAEDPSQALRPYTLHYCANDSYVTTARAYYSYVRWSRSAILAALRELPVPAVAVKGSADHRMGSSWAGLVAEAGAAVVMVDGANHFFDARHEVPLHDIVVELLEARDAPHGRH